MKQGYLFARPLEVNEIDGLLQTAVAKPAVAGALN